MGIEPTSEAWEASILPLYDARSDYKASKSKSYPQGPPSAARHPRLDFSADLKLDFSRGSIRNRAARLDRRVYIAGSGAARVRVVEPARGVLLPTNTAGSAMEDAMNAPAVKSKEHICQAVSHVDEPCVQPAKQYCVRCGLWYCRTHFPDPDWHPCAPDQGTG